MSAQRITLALATILVGLAAGFFFAYEISVTVGLARVSDESYVEVFQAVNATIKNLPFAIVFFGSIPALVLATVLHRTADRTTITLLVSSLVLLLAGIVITGTQNVPLNNDLAAVVPTSPEVLAQARATFEGDWNRFNLLRTLTSGLSFALLVLAGLVHEHDHTGAR